MEEGKRYSEFDREFDRKSTHDLKWRRAGVESYLSQEVREDMIPMWIADTDFGCMKGIVDAVKARAEHEIYGYCAPGADFCGGVAFWEKKRFDWEISPGWVTALPSVVGGINIAIRAFSREGEGVIIQTPVYDPFITIVKRTGRIPVYNSLKVVEGHYEMDFEGLEEQVKDPNNRMLILCSPHNPVGRVWTETELRRLADLCLKHGVMVVTDEIHSDIVYGERRHYPLLSLDPQYGDRFIHLSAPGKTFNVPGLKMSFAIIPNPAVKKAFDEMQLAMSLDIRNTFGVECVKACYTEEGEAWLNRLLEYLEGNVDMVCEFIRDEMPKVRMERPEGTFLCWLDFSEYGMADEELLRRVNLDAGVICVPGDWFGNGGEHHLRLNIGCQRKTLIANSTVILTTSIRGVIAFVALALPRKLPELWKKSAFYVSDGKLKVICIIAMILAVVSVLMLLITTSPMQIFGNCCILGVAVVLSLVFHKKVEVKASYKDR